ncbi:MAG: PQQ-binding-like beta-propeller repeat protein [Actinomycetaceae bacterium]|nr:PQQ-binding-like beta-propeller repeat protein [Actinomycetaceae bacterium]
MVPSHYSDSPSSVPSHLIPGSPQYRDYVLRQRKRNQKKERHRSLKRWLIVLIIVALLATMAFGSYWVWKRYFHQIPANGVYAKAPSVVSEIKPADFGLSTFLPLYGPGNKVTPISYGDVAILAGAQGTNTTLMSISETGTALWQTTVPEPLIACAHSLVENKLPCLFKGKEDSGVALVDITNGHTSWIYQSREPMINLDVSSGSTITLLGQDLSVTPIDSSGVQLDEAMEQIQGDEEQLADVSQCDLPSHGTLSYPERYTHLSKDLSLITHNGLTQVIDRSNNQVLASTSGKVLEDFEPPVSSAHDNVKNSESGSSISPQEDEATPPENKDEASDAPDKTDQSKNSSQDESAKQNNILVVASPTGCSPALLINPDSHRFLFLPDDVIVPAGQGGTIPSTVIRDGTFHTMNWEAPTVGMAVYRDTDAAFEVGPELIQSEHKTIVLTRQSVIALDRHTGRIIWTTDLDARYGIVLQDVVLLSLPDGTLQALALQNGERIWSTNAYGFSSIIPGSHQSINIHSSQGLMKWVPAQAGKDGPQVQVGRAAQPGTVKPGIRFIEGDCVRVEKLDSGKDQYKARVTKVDCSLQGAEPVVSVLTTNDVARGKDSKDYLEQCEKTDGARSALTLDSPLVDNNISGICTGEASH